VGCRVKPVERAADQTLMKRWIALSIVSPALLGLVAFTGFAVGGRLGFYEGYGVAAHASDVTTATMLTVVRKGLEKSDAQSLDLLETAIDHALISDWADRHLAGDRPFYAPPDAYLDFSRSMKQIAAYRRARPRKPTNGPGEAMIQESLARYAPVPVTP
jgi:hypothetical protein